MRDFLLFLQAFFSPKPYARALSGRFPWGKAFGFNCVVLMAIIIAMTLGAVGYIAYQIEPVVQKMPPLEIVDGEVITKLEKPVVLPVLKDSTVLIDPELRMLEVIKKKRQDHHYYLVKDGFVRRSGKTYKVDSFRAVEQETIGPETVHFYEVMIVFGAFIAAPIMLLGLVIGALILGWPIFLFCLGCGAALTVIFTRTLKPGRIAAVALLLILPMHLYGVALSGFLGLPQISFFMIMAALLLGSLALYARFSNDFSYPNSSQEKQ